MSVPCALSVPYAFGEKQTQRARTALCSAGPERHGYHVMKDDMVSAWAPAVGRNVDVRWVPRNKEKLKQESSRHL